MLYIVHILKSTNDVASMFKIPSSYPKNIPNYEKLLMHFFHTVHVVSFFPLQL
jgi:hypothetical protein